MNQRDHSTSLRSRGTLTALGILAVVLGMVVLTGWYGQYPRLIRISPGLAPMAPRSALSFLGFGCGLLALVLGRRGVSMAFAGVVALNNGLTLIVYSMATGVDLDRVLHLPAGFLPTKPVAPNTAACFLLLSAALLLMGCRPCLRGRAMALASVSSVTIALSAISLIGYLSGVKTYEWGALTPMAPHTSAGLALLSLGVMKFSWRDERAAEAGAPSWLFASITVIAVVFTISLWHALAADVGAQVRRAIVADAAELSHDLVSQMRLRTEALARSAHAWERRDKPGPAEWEFESSQLLSDKALGFRTVEWVDPSLRIQMVAPHEGNERLWNADLSLHPGRRSAFESARTQRRAVMTQTLEMLTGRRNIQIYSPVFKHDDCQGFIVGVVLADELFSTLFSPTVVPGENIQILADGEAIYTRAGLEAGPLQGWSQQVPLDIDGLRWTLRITPSREKLNSLRSSIPEMVLWSGLLLAVLAGASVYLAQKAWERARTAEALRRAIEKEAGERRQAEEELNQFFALSVEMLCVAGLDGWFKRVNPAFERILGYTPEELLARPFLDLVHPDDREATLAAVRRLATGAPLIGFENRYRARDGSIRWMQWQCAPAPNRMVAFAAARDVTELKASQESLQRAHDELEGRVKERTAALERSNQSLSQRKKEILKLNQELERRLRELTITNQELEAFTYSVSHDLRAPLRHVDGFSKILQEEYGAQLPEDAWLLLDRVRQSSQKMGLMVDELLELSRLGRRELEKRLTGLRTVVDEVIADLATETAGREVEWRIAEMPFADCDPVLIRQVFVNLFSNALKFTRTRAKALIEVGQTEAAGGRVLFVRDNGIGFSMKYVAKLFGVFQRLHRQEDFEGTGVGLATVQRIIRKHGGQIWAEGALDQGATFYFTLAPPGDGTAEIPGPAEPVREVQRAES